MINDHLSYQGRSLRILPGKLLLGPTGRRLFVDYLEKEPGFSGRIDFIHTINLTGLFRIRCTAVNSYEEAETTWYPSMLVMKLDNPKVSLTETKFVTWDDCAVSCQRWVNKTSQPMELKLEVEAALCETGVDAGTGCLTLVSPKTEHGFAVGAAIRSDIGLEKGPLRVEPGESVEFVVPLPSATWRSRIWAASRGERWISSPTAWIISPGTMRNTRVSSGMFPTLSPMIWC